MFSFTIGSKTLVLVMHPVVRAQKRSTEVVTNQEKKMTNRDRVKSQGYLVQREDHKAVTEVFMHAATKRKEINYSPPPLDPRVMDLRLHGIFSLFISKSFQHKESVGRSCQKYNERLA